MKKGSWPLSRSTGIGAQLVALVVAAVLPLVGLLAWNVYDESLRGAEAARDEVRHMAEITASETARFLGQAQNILHGFATRPAVHALDPGR